MTEIPNKTEQNQEEKEKEETIKRIVATLMQEKTTNIKNIHQEKNKEFKKIKQHSPIQKKGGKLGLFKRKKYIKIIDYQQQLKEEIQKEKPNIEKIKKLQKIIEKRKLQKKPLYIETNFKTPLLEMIRADGRIEWYEGAKAGTLNFNRKDEQIGYIDLRKDKLLTDEIKNEDGTNVQKWICYENDMNPLPHQQYVDSHGYFSNLEEVLQNKKDWKTERLKARNDMMVMGIAGIVIILIAVFVAIPMFTGKTLFEQLPQQKTTTQAQPTELGNLTPTEIATINNMRAQNAQQQANEQSGG